MLKSFKCAADGMIYTLKNERNMRSHTVAAFYILLLSLFFEFNVEKYAVLFLTIGSVMALEMVNTSIEGIIDICAKEYNATAKMAKDIAAGAVMISSIVAVVIGLLLFCDVSSYVKIWLFFCSHKIILTLFLLSIFVSAVYIRFGPVEIKNQLKCGIKFIKNLKV